MRAVSRLAKAEGLTIHRGLPTLEGRRQDLSSIDVNLAS
jgi:hypothetical protein